MTRLDQAVTDILTRLADKVEKVWTRDEIELYYKDGYDEFCRRTKVLFDLWVIENLPPVGNWQTDLERYYISQKPGWGATDEPFHMTNDEQNFGVGGRVGGTYRGPSGMTSPSERAYVDTLDATDGAAVPTSCPGGTLPSSVVEVRRVTFNQRELPGQSSMFLRQIDPYYETHTGDPQCFTFDKDGINFLRVVPQADGGASYDTVDATSGPYGTFRQTSDSTVTVSGKYGILRWRSDTFPAMGRLGTPRRVHPADDNIQVEITRLGRSLDNYPVELPLAYEKYVAFWAMSRALRRDGPGQNIELAEHYEQRFDMGVSRMCEKRDRMAEEMVGHLGKSPTVTSFGLGEPQLPYPYSIPMR